MDRLVPFLILFATLLFLAQGAVQRLLKTHPAHGPRGRRWLVGAMIFQLFVALYGGYFGAGMGILMLAALGVIGLMDIYEMNGLKNLFAISINGVAAIYFIAAGMVQWPFVLVMATGAIAGGLGGANVARRLGQVWVRRFVLFVGFSMAVALFLKK
jgi:uncharacterized membrane protein YfcA